MRHQLVVPDAFAVVMKATNYNGCQFHLIVSKVLLARSAYIAWNMALGSTGFGLIVEVLEVRVKFLQPLVICRNFVKELVILFHRTAAAP